MDFDRFLDQAWTDHAEQATAVAERLADPATLALLHQEDQVAQLAFLAQHVHGQHLARWTEGVAFQQQLAALPVVQADGSTAAALQRHVTVLRLAGGLEDPRASLGRSEASRITASAAAALCPHDGARAQALLDEALAAVEAEPLPDTDPAVRAMAVAGNNIAGSLEELPMLSDAQCRLMVQAAQVGRRYWARAGTWLEIERAEYRLAKTWIKAGDLQQAQHHARCCLEIVQAHDGAALERLYAWEALGCVASAQGDAAAHAAALAEARAAYAGLDEGDRGWCLAPLQALEVAAPAAAG